MTSSTSVPEMETLWDLFFVMTHLFALQRASRNTLLDASREDRIAVVERLRMLQAALQRLELKQADTRSSLLISELIDKLERRRQLSLPVGGYADQLHELAQQVYRDLELEAADRNVFVAKRSRSGTIEAFLDDPPRYLGFTAAEAAELPAESREDFDISARCYAIGFNTASLVFLLRGVEAVTKQYYCRVTGHVMAEEKGRWMNWNDKLNIPKLDCPKDVLKLSRTLCDTRNALMHARPRQPSESSDTTTQRTLEQCKSFFEQMRRSEITEDLASEGS